MALKFFSNFVSKISDSRDKIGILDNSLLQKFDQKNRKIIISFKSFKFFYQDGAKKLRKVILLE